MQKSAIEKKVERWGKSLDQVIMKDTIDSQESKTKKPQSLKRRFDNVPLEDARLMVPIIYPKGMDLERAWEQQYKEKKSGVNLMSSLGQNLRTQVDSALGFSVNEEDKNHYKPSSKIRSRLKSEHLNFLQRQDLETTAREFYELQDFLKKMPESQRQLAIQNEQPKQKQEPLIKQAQQTKPGKIDTKNFQFRRSTQVQDKAKNHHISTLTGSTRPQSNYSGKAGTRGQMQQKTRLFSAKAGSKRINHFSVTDNSMLDQSLLFSEDTKVVQSQDLAATQKFSTHQSRFGAAKSTTRFGKNAAVHDNLFEATDDRENLKQHFAVRWQSEKDNLVTGMANNLEKYKATIKLSDMQMARKLQHQTDYHAGQKNLQELLTNQFGIKVQQKVQVPGPCEEVLNEAPYLRDKKKQKDQVDHKRRKSMNDRCRVMAKAAKMDSEPPSQRDQIIIQSDAEIPSQFIESTAEDLPSQSNTTNLNIEVPPRDGKVNVCHIAGNRIRGVRDNYMSRIADKRKNAAGDKGSMPASPASNRSLASGKGSQGILQSTLSLNQSQEKVIADAVNPMIIKNKLWNQMSDAINLKVKAQMHNINAGIGERPTGAAKRRIKMAIQHDLDNEISEKEFEIDDAMRLDLPDFMWDSHKLRQPVPDMDGIDFWLQKGMQKAVQGKADAAMDYYRQGLRKNVTNLTLIYNLANSYKKLNKYSNALTWFMHGISLHPRWVDGLCGLATTYFNMKDYQQALRFITVAKDNCKGTKSDETFVLDLKTIGFIKAASLKMTSKFHQSGLEYGYLEETFKMQRMKELATYMFGLVLIPMQEDRKFMLDHLENVKEIAEYMKDVPMLKQENQNLSLSKYCKEKERLTGLRGIMSNESRTQKLDWSRFEQSILKLFSIKSFFKRFSNEQLKDKLLNAEIETFTRGQSMFLGEKIGIILQGAIEIRHHNSKPNTDNPDPRTHRQSLLTPFTIHKAIEGDILGFDKISKNPLTWFLAMQDETEVLLLNKKEFYSLFNLQKQDPERQIILQKLEQNKYFKQLETLTKYYIVYELLHEKVYFPGELIMSVHPRSPLCADYLDYYKPVTTRFRREIDQKIVSKDNAPTDGGATAKNADPASHWDGLRQLVESAANSKIDLSQDEDGEANEKVNIQTKQVVSSSDEFDDGFDSPTVIQKKFAKINQTKRNLLAMEEQNAETDSNSTDYGLNHAETMVQGPIEIDRLLDDDSEDTELSMREIHEEDETPHEFSVPALLNPKDHQYKDEPSAGQSGSKLPSYLNEEIIAKYKANQPKKLKPKDKIKAKESMKNYFEMRAAGLMKFTIAKGLMSIKRREKDVMQQHKKRKRELQSILIKLNNARDVFAFQNKFIPEVQKVPKFASAQSTTTNQNIQELLPRKRSLKQVFTMNIDEAENEMQNVLDQVQAQKEDLKHLTAGRQRLSSILSRSSSYYESLDFNTPKVGADRRHTQKAIGFPVKNFLSSPKKGELNGFRQKSAGLRKRASIRTKGSLAIEEEPISSGFQNLNYVNALQTTVKDIMREISGHQERDGQTNNELYKQLIGVISSIQAESGEKPTRLEPDGIHFIEQGEVLVLGPDSMPLTIMSKCDDFGMCEILKRTGPEFMGDIRAGLTTVKTFYVPYKDIEKRLSYTERVKLQEIEKENNNKEALINLISTKDEKIEDKKAFKDKLRRF